MSSDDLEDVEVDGFLESDKSVDDLLKEEYGPREADTGFYKDLQPQTDTRDMDPDAPASSDEQLIKGRGMELTHIDTDDVELELELSKEEEVAATHGGSDGFNDPTLNAIHKATASERERRTRAEMDKRELLDLAGEMVDDYFRKNVKTDGIDDAKLKRLKFAARKQLAQQLAE